MIRRFTFKVWGAVTYIQFDNDTEPGKQYDYIDGEWKFVCQAHSNDRIWGNLESAACHAKCIEVDENCVPIPPFEKGVLSVYDFL